MSQDKEAATNEGKRCLMSQQLTIACMYFRALDPTQYDFLLSQQQNEFANARDMYSKSLAEAYAKVLHYIKANGLHPQPNLNSKPKKTVTPGYTFAQQSILSVRTTSGIQDSSQVGHLTNLGDMWWRWRSLAIRNIPFLVWISSSTEKDQ